MDIFLKYRASIVSQCVLLFPDADTTVFDPITAEPPKDSSHGDIATNAAMVLAKPLGRNPREVATLLAEKLREQPTVASAEVAGPGFINIRLNNDAWLEIIRQILSDKDFGKNNIGKGEKINVEYVSANPTGPMHIGHARNAVLGDVLANILAASGYDVTREYYINDAGAQVKVLAQSAMLRYREAMGEDIGEIPAGLYPGEYLIDVGQKAKHIYGDSLLKDPNALTKLQDFAVAEMMVMIKNDLGILGVKHDVFTSEAALHRDNAVEKSIEFLKGIGLVYRGILEPPKGKAPEDWEPKEQLLFRATEFGDDVDRALQKSDGSNTYFSGDVAYHKNKVDRGFNNMVLTLGADHGGYVKRLSSVVKALSGGKASVTVLLSQLVNLVENGEPVKMSKRAGNFVTMRDVIDRVGAGVVRFIMLTRKADAVIDFDLAKVLETTRENPVFYVQYAHARICSALRSAAEQNLLPKDAEDLSALKHPAELDLVRKLAEYPRVVRQAAVHMEPHRVSFYLCDLAATFHQLWNVGKDEDLRFINPDNPVATKARLNLITACKTVIASGLDLLGVQAVERM